MNSSNRLIKLRIPKPKNLKNDILSGMTVSLALVPEAIAFAFLLGIDPTIGLYTSFIMGIIISILGGRPGMISGAAGAVAIVYSHMMHELMADGAMGMDTAIHYLFAAVILMGLIQLLFGVLRLGKFIRLIPHPVMLGFVNGLAIVICRSQFGLFSTVGVPESQRFAVMAIMILLIITTMAIAKFLPKLTTAVPATLVAFLVVTVISLILNKMGVEVRTVIDFVQQKDPTKLTLAGIPGRLGIPKVPMTMETLKLIGPYAVLAATVGLIETLMTLTLVDELTETRGKSNKESMGLGLGNLAAGFLGGMGGCAMIGQTVINVRAGGRGRTSGITTALTLLFFVLVGAPFVENIPLAAIVGVMFMVVIGTFEWSSFRVMKRIPFSDALVIVLVSAITVLTDLAIAVGVGIIVSALVFAWKKGQTMSAEERVDEHGTHIYTINGSLFFGSVASFKELFNFEEVPKEVVIDFKHSRVYDHSGLEAINYVAEKYAQQDKKLHLLNLSSDCKILLTNAESIVEATIIDGLDWHVADNRLD